MKGKYTAAFIVPVATIKILTGDGWEFKGSGRLPKSLEKYLVGVLNVRFVEAYSSIAAYANNHVKMSILFDDCDQIESIYFQMADGCPVDLCGLLSREGAFSGAEVFIPGKLQARQGGCLSE